MIHQGKCITILGFMSDFLRELIGYFETAFGIVMLLQRLERKATDVLLGCLLAQELQLLEVYVHGFTVQIQLPDLQR